jgi:hypothetical protein
VSSNWKNWFLRPGRDREHEETLELYRQVARASPEAPFTDEAALHRFVTDLIFEICERRGVTPSAPLADALYHTIRLLLAFEGFVVELPEEGALPNLTLEEAVHLRATWRRHLRFLSDQERLLALWREKLIWVFSGLLEYFPLSAFADIGESGSLADDSVILPEARACDLCDNLPEALDRLLITFYDEDVVNAQLFALLRERFDDNAFRASGIPPERRHEGSGKLIMPTRNANQSPEYLVQAYLQGTPFYRFFESPLPFAIPFPARFEHTHIVGGTGHGKTQLLQFLINHDLTRALEDGRSVVVMDSQGDLIRTISRLGCFSPAAPESLADRFVLVDPNDVLHPVSLNMFDFNRDRLGGFAAVDREKVLNATIEIYEYFFGALLGAELTQRQGLIFKYLARLLLEIPNATIHTLRELMEDGERFRPYMEGLTGTARSFFLTRFFDRSFNETKKQVLTRLWGVLSNASLERMFSHPKNKVDIFELLNSGKIILINTAKDLLGQEGSAIFGRFFIALIAQAAVQRVTVPPHERKPAFVYIDEAEDYFDDNISHLLTQARKYRIGLLFAHQNLGQLSAQLLASVLANTSIKFAGGVSAKDARTLDAELRCDAEFLLAQKKEREWSEFVCYVRNYTGKALSVRIPLGFVESLPTLTDAEATLLVEENRRRYSEPASLPEYKVPPPEAVPAVPAVPKEPEVLRPVSTPSERRVPPKETAPILPPVVPSKAVSTAKATKKRLRPDVKEPALPGRGGQQHKYLQHVIKQLAEERGFRASIEELVLDGAGRADVSLLRGDQRIACEISVTTNRDQELANVEKCLAAGYSEVIVVGINERHLKSLQKFIGENLDEANRGKVSFVVPEALIEHLDLFGESPVSDEQIVRGYKVRTVKQVLDPKEASARRQAIAQVVARSLVRQGKRE